MDYFKQESERLLFRKLTLEDVQSWTEFFVDNNLLEMIGFDMSKSHYDLAHGWISKQLERYKDEGLGHLAVIEKSTGEFIGMSGIIPRELEGKNYYEIAYSFKPKYWGKGFASEASQKMKTFGFESKISDQYISMIDIENYASQAVARKNKMEIGFNAIFEGMEVHVFITKEK